GSVFLLSAALLTLALYQLTRLQYRSEARPRADGASALTLGALFSDIGDGFAYVERDPRLVVVLVLVGFHCGATMAFDSMMPTLATVVGGSSLTFSGIVVGIGAGAIVGTFVVSMLPTEEATGRSFLVVGVGSGLAMLVIGFATTPFMAVTGGVLAGATQASYMALSSTFVQAIVPDAFRGRVMSLYVLLAAGHMAFVNFGFGWLSDGIGVRALLIVPGLLWIVVFVAAVFLLPEVRALVSTGAFRARPAPAAVSAEA
ncbi:MAG: MFS transporter, partial [Chloroflexi bacterium]|nr:MFS transporter [Chloroflexota bacterium]